MLINVHIAPSPTGLLHIGNIRAALFNYLFARHNSGAFMLRLTDRERSTEKYAPAEDSQRQILHLMPFAEVRERLNALGVGAIDETFRTAIRGLNQGEMRGPSSIIQDFSNPFEQFM